MGVDEKHPLNSTGGSETHSHNPGTLSAQVSLEGQNTVVRRVSIPDFVGDVRHIGDIHGGSFNSSWGAERRRINIRTALCSVLVMECVYWQTIDLHHILVSSIIL